jgi:hypothetical protein
MSPVARGAELKIEIKPATENQAAHPLTARALRKIRAMNIILDVFYERDT